MYVHVHVWEERYSICLCICLSTCVCVLVWCVHVHVYCFFNPIQNIILQPLYAGVAGLCEDAQFTICLHREDTLAAAKGDDMFGSGILWLGIET